MTSGKYKHSEKQNKNISIALHAFYVSRWQPRFCLNCGSEFKPPKPSSDKKFCNRKCYVEYRTKTGGFSKIGGWNRGLTKETDVRVLKNAVAIGKALQNSVAYAKYVQERVNWNKGLTKETNSILLRVSEAMKKEWKGNFALRAALAVASSPFTNMSFEERSVMMLKIWKNAPSERREKLSRIVKPTSIEILAQESLAGHGYAFLVGKRIENLVAPDQILLDFKIAIFEDGCYWHGCPEHNSGEYSIHGKSISSIRNHDKFVGEELERCGWTVIRVWEHEIKKEHDIVGKLVEKIVQKKDVQDFIKTGKAKLSSGTEESN